MAPEQIAGGAIDPRTDIYALGVMLYRLGAGRYPYSEGNVLQQHRLADIPDPTQHNASLPMRFAAIVARAMAKDPDWRYPTAEELLADLESLDQSPRRSSTAQGPTFRPAEPPPTPSPAAPPRRPSTGRMRVAKAAPVKRSTANGLGIAQPSPKPPDR